jgi:HSP20 family protein
MEPFDLFRISPYTLMRRFMEDMEQQWASLGIGRGEQGMTATGGTSFAPPMEMFERNGHLVVRADLPGLTKDDIQVEVTEEGLTIAGERRSEHEEKQGGMFRSERHYGTFRRHIPLPEGIDAAQVQASFQDGVLEVTMPAPQQQAHGRRIEIHSDASSSSATASGAGHHASSPANREHVQTRSGGA